VLPVGVGLRVHLIALERRHIEVSIAGRLPDERVAEDGPGEERRREHRHRDEVGGGDIPRTLLKRPLASWVNSMPITPNIAPTARMSGFVPNAYVMPFPKW